METIVISDKQSQPVKLSPAAFLPAASFTIANNTGMNIKVTVDRKTIVIEKEGGEG